jgi:hypothetical protein
MAPEPEQEAPPMTFRCALRNLRRLLPTRVVLVLVPLLLTGCFVKLAYENLDTLLLWRIDSYFNLSPEQTRFVERRIEEQLHWHRGAELPKTIAFFREVQTAAKDSLTPAELEELFASFETGVSVVTMQLSADAAELFAQIDDEQIVYLQNALNEANEEWEERLELPPDERREDREERILDLVEDWVGDLDDAQRKELVAASARIPDILEAWLNYRRERQRQFVNIVRAARMDKDIVRIALPAWVGAEPPPQFLVHQRAVREFILEVDKRCTPEQRAFFIDRLQGWIDDLETFTAKPT